MTVIIDGTTGIDSPGGDVSVSQSLSGNLTFTGTENRITGDFSNATVANRVLFQSSTTNGITSVTAIPNGTATDARFAVNNNSDPTNSNGIQILANATEARIQATNFGTASAFPMTFYTGGSERARIDTSGNLLVGNSTYLLSGMTAGQAIQLGARTFIGTTSSGDTSLGGLSGSNFTSFLVNATERGRFDSSGNLLVGKTTDSFSTQGTVIGPNAEITLARTGSDSVMRFASTNTGLLVGSINITTTATSYATSSDYRLKENVAPMQNALATIAELKPVTYTWKAGGSAGQGFIAHELQEVVPDCVTGEKDAVDKDGNPQYQGVDTSFLVATLVAAIQELKAEVDSLKAQIQGTT